jgi:DHA1 family inner membrane transport protein
MHTISQTASLPSFAPAAPFNPATASAARKRLTILALALGSFAIGTTEFASMGMLQQFAPDLGISLTHGTHAIGSYAFGVVLGAPLVTLAAARMNRRTLLIGLMLLFVLGNILSAIAASIGQFSVARFLSGLPQGAYFGAGAVVASYILGPGQAGKAFAMVMTGLTVATIFGAPLATFLGQLIGWRETYLAIGGLGLLALMVILIWVPKTRDLAGAPVMQELSALRRGRVWAVLAAASLGVGSIFAVYTFIGPFITDLSRLDPVMVPVALGMFGIGMTLGNVYGGQIADRAPSRGIIFGFALALVALAATAVLGGSPILIFPLLLAVGATTMIAIPAIQARLTEIAPDAPSLIGAMNLAALNLANALGAWAGAATIDAGLGLLSAAWAGFALTLAGLVVAVATRAK